MIVTGHLYVDNPNYLPITFQSMKMDIYFNHTVARLDSNESNCQMLYLWSFTNSWNELQNEQIYDVDYPFYVTLQQHIENDTLTSFADYVTASCKASGSYVLRAHIYPRYEYTDTERQIAFYTDTHANQGCPTNLTSKAVKSEAIMSTVKKVNTVKLTHQLVQRYTWIEDLMRS